MDGCPECWLRGERERDALLWGDENSTRRTNMRKMSTVARRQALDMSRSTFISFIHPLVHGGPIVRPLTNGRTRHASMHQDALTRTRTRRDTQTVLMGGGCGDVCVTRDQTARHRPSSKIVSSNAQIMPTTDRLPIM
mmetsp:Transcript_42628/g.106458  ORF Transcript_42628/g.106458 Transcript_42628/m.106458 type:complete len:137 (+) Transcript_42628:948-1358(+)